jgi:hypothetical protein
VVAQEAAVGLGAVVVLEAVVVLPVAAAVAMAGQEVQRLARLADRTAVTHLHLDILPERTQWEVALKAELATAELATAELAMAPPKPFQQQSRKPGLARSHCASRSPSGPSGRSEAYGFPCTPDRSACTGNTERPDEPGCLGHGRRSPSLAEIEDITEPAHAALS